MYTQLCIYKNKINWVRSFNIDIILYKYLSGTHGGFKGGEAMIERAENGDHVIGDGLALF